MLFALFLLILEHISLLFNTLVPAFIGLICFAASTFMPRINEEIALKANLVICQSIAMWPNHQPYET